VIDTLEQTSAMLIHPRVVDRYPFSQDIGHKSGMNYSTIGTVLASNAWCWPKPVRQSIDWCPEVPV